MRWHLKLILVAVWVFAAQALAGPGQAERRLALVIGNGDYKVGPLANPTNDSTLIAATLEGAGFEVTHVQNLGYRDLQRSVIGFGRNLRAAGEDTVGLVYYAGHAVQAGGENYLIPVDADLQDSLDLEIQTLQVGTLMKSLEAAGNRLNMVVLDACRNNPFPSMSRSADRGLAKIDAPFGTLLAYSTAPGDVAADGSGANSPYTRALAKAIRLPGLPVEQMFKQVRLEVMERTGNQQVPWESSSLTGDFYFTPEITAPVVQVPTPPPPPTITETNNDAEIEYWKSIANSSDPLQFQGYLSAYPNGLFADLALQRVTALQAQQQSAAAEAERQAREDAAQTMWEAVKDSTDPALLKTVVDQYPGTLYAQLAQVKIQSLLQSRSEATVAAVDPERSIDQGGNSEQLFWESIKDSPNRTDYQAYLDRYPNGIFAGIAASRVENGYSPQVASLDSTVAAHPYDGQWVITWKVIGRNWNSSWCRGGEKGTKEVTISNGLFEGGFSSNYSGSAQLKLEVSETGAVKFMAKVSGWSNPSLIQTFDLSSGSITDEELRGIGYCMSTFSMHRP